MKGSFTEMSQLELLAWQRRKMLTQKEVAMSNRNAGSGKKTVLFALSLACLLGAVFYILNARQMTPQEMRQSVPIKPKI